MLYIMNSSLKYQGLRLGDSKDMAVGPSFLPWIVCLWAFIQANFLLTFVNWIGAIWSRVFKLARNIISIVSLRLDPLLFKLGDNHLVGWLSLVRHRVHVTYYVFPPVQFNVLLTFVLYHVCSFLAYQRKLWIKTTNNYLILHNWLPFLFVLTKDKFFLLFFYRFQALGPLHVCLHFFQLLLIS